MFGNSTKNNSSYSPDPIGRTPTISYLMSGKVHLRYTHTLYHSPILTHLQQLTILKSYIYIYIYILYIYIYIYIHIHIHIYIYIYSPNISDTSNHSTSTSVSFCMFNLWVTGQRTPTISDLFLFSPDVQPMGNYSHYNIVQKHFTIYLSLNKSQRILTIAVHFIFDFLITEYYNPQHDKYLLENHKYPL